MLPAEHVLRLAVTQQFYEDKEKRKGVSYFSPFEIPKHTPGPAVCFGSINIGI
jgi:hypothetical protein